MSIQTLSFKGIELPVTEWEERLWSRVVKGERDECWEWKGTRNQKGYGTFAIRINGKQIRFIVHRLSYALEHNHDPGKLFTCHRCDNPPCVNPHHLFLGTARANNLDAFRKGRNQVVGAYAKCGEDNVRSLYTREQVAEMRKLANEEGWGVPELRAEFGGSRGGVHAILSGANWKNIA
ncbi:MAG: HNH endonuclease [Tildeniella torsiva UHER 1998/13D]|nr:HNH endonuclease [Tildeniella torsiva UHER 1998/13D]